MAKQAREIRLKSRPVGMPEAANFEVVTVELKDPGPGEVLVRNGWMSVDPYMRGRMYDRPSYVPPFALGEALQGGAVGTVVKSNDPNFAAGDLVESNLGWREAFVSTGAPLTKLAGGVPPQAYLGVLGMPGMTAYTSFHRIGDPKPGNVVFVSGAGGAVGSTVCQIAKIRECTVVASAGSDEKLDWLKSVGVDEVVNYKKGNLLENVRKAAPKGIDIYFDNVGGEHLEVALEVARPWARFIECGMISVYNDKEPSPGPRNMPYIVGKRIKMQGFIVFDFIDMREQFITEMTQWVKDGRIKWQETIENGIENAPKAFLTLFSGGNAGKMLVKLD
ncbi:NADP-dependent oxidoreductase [Terricaulis silvestris]|uniref:NADP-dependent oxidoreductase YfmJ n=1 Tax=Terricaulis silvestris TaxID=2686094 RepID=A0A6I6MT55_9CAUL|nr:NADP-dependent oxidoreductase [Terricaulis silvestris]QGZ94862.1 Putative NADP-dependent oxidoreductase YfmJ [Terricaulis silvestris]